MTNFGKTLVWTGVVLVVLGLSFVLDPLAKKPTILNPGVKITPAQTNVDEISVIPKAQATSTPYVVTGYYMQYEKIRVADGFYYGTTSCDAFVVTKNDNPLIEDLINTVRIGNTVNSILPDGNLRIHLNFKDIRAELIEKIKSSTPQNQTTVIMSHKIQEAKDAPPCASFVDIWDK